MHSPLDPDRSLKPVELEPGLRAFVCPKTGGHWIPLPSYFSWRELHGSSTNPLPPDYKPELADDSSQRALICPESGYLLVRYRVGRGLNFSVDRSPKTGGVWLDAGEWNALKSKGLHDELHLIFTAPYQARILSEAADSQLEDRFRERIGADAFARVAEFRAWLRRHPKRRDILAYLLDEEGKSTVEH